MPTPDNSGKPPFWTSLPGILTGITGLIAAIGSVLGILYNNGVIGHKDMTPPVEITRPGGEHEPTPPAVYKDRPETQRQCFIQADELDAEDRPEVPIIKPELESALSNAGYTIADDRLNARYVMKIQAISKKNSEVFGQYTASVDLEISALDQASSKKLYSKSLAEIKGSLQVGLSQASKDAYRRAATKVRQSIIPELLAAMSKK